MGKILVWSKKDLSKDCFSVQRKKTNYTVEKLGKPWMDDR